MKTTVRFLPTGCNANKWRAKAKPAMRHEPEYAGRKTAEHAKPVNHEEAKLSDTVLIKKIDQRSEERSALAISEKVKKWTTMNTS